MTNECITSSLPSPPGASANLAEWSVIHAGKELGPLSLTELAERAVAGEISADDLVKQAGGLWTSARDCGILQPHFLMHGSTEQQRETCFFCKLNPTDEPLAVSLYNITKRTNTYVVVGVSCETRYLTTKVEVPKCRDCEQKHFRLVLTCRLLVLVVLIGVLAFIGSIYWDGWKRGELTFGFVCTFPIAFALVSLIVLVPIGFIFMFIEIALDACGFNTERRSRQYPPIKALLSDGWEVGTKPPYKGGDI